MHEEIKNTRAKFYQSMQADEGSRSWRSLKALVVYYSRTGTTGKVAEKISELLGGDLEELHDVTKRSGMIGWLKAGRDAGSRKLTKLETVKNDPAAYDIVVIGTPIWNHTMSTPVRTYISQYKGSFKKVAFFCTAGGSKDLIFDEMESLCGKKPVATLRLLMKQEVESGHYVEKIKT
jgi:flavodoxin